MSRVDFTTAISQWQTAVGTGHVLAGDDVRPHLAEVTALQREVPAVLLPGSTDEVAEVVRIANAHGTPLYPISRGCNWGMGSRLPVRDGCAIVDLGRMDTIRELNTEHQYAVVEPGVTQGQLHQRLQDEGLPLTFNVTGSGSETSLIGNALERGVGYFSSRAESLSGLEVVLGTGEVVRTGCGHYASSAITHLYKYGIGPQLDGLFHQGNFGIVTSAGMELLPRGEAQMALIARIDEDRALERFMEALTALRKSGIIQTAVHIANRHRTVSAMAPLIAEQLRQQGETPSRESVEALIAAEGFGPWSAVAGIMGSREQLGAARRDIARALKGVAHTAFMTDAKLAFAKRLSSALSFMPAMARKQLLLNVIEPLYGLSKGIPTSGPLKSVYWCVDEPVPTDDHANPDHSNAGFQYCLPMIPMSGRDARRAVDMTEACFNRSGFDAYITLNMVNDKVLEGVINLAYKRSDTGRRQAAATCIRELEQQFMDCGYILYRVGVDNMDSVVDPEDTFWQTAAGLKSVLDPNGIIAPGRYSLR